MIEAVVRSALVLGTAYALVGVAVATVSVAARTLHLAIGPILVVAVLTHAVLLSAGLPVALAALGAVVGATLLSAGLEPVILRPLAARGGDPTRSVEPARTTGVLVRWVIGLAVAAAILETVAARWLIARPIRTPALVGGDEGTAALVVAVAGAAAGVVLLAWAVHRTGWGRRLRLVGGSSRASELAGVSPTRVRAGALAVSGAAAALAGLLIAPVVGIGVGQAGGLTLRAVAAAVILGVGGPVRAAAAGLLLGGVEAAAQGLAPGIPGDVWIGVLAVVVLVARGGEWQTAWGRAW